VSQRPPTAREVWLSTGRMFLLAALALVAFGAYKYAEYARAEEKPTLLHDWTLHLSLYDWGGKAAVLGFYLVAALVMLVASAVGYRGYSRLPPDEGPP